MIATYAIRSRIMHNSMRMGKLVFEDGTIFPGRSVGAPVVASGEICFTTAMAGYEEAVSDPSYAGQILTFSYPLVGNYGVDPARMESGRVWTRGVVMRRARPEWAEWLAAQGIPALEGLEVIVVPGTYDADSVLELDPRAVVIGNGPGDPAQLTGPIQTVRDLLGQ